MIYGDYYHGRCWTEVVSQKEIFLYRTNIILAKKYRVTLIYTNYINF